MQIIKSHNRKSQPVKKYAQIEREAGELVSFIEENQGKFQGQYQTCFALSHAQVNEEPFDFFVVDKDWTKGGGNPKGAPKNQLFPSQVIINAKVLSIPDRVRKIKNGQEMLVPNAFRIEEACMSFQHRNPKKVERFFEIEVEYQIPRTGFWKSRSGGMKRIREKAQGLKAHILQHEIDHANGKNIIYGNTEIRANN